MNEGVCRRVALEEAKATADKFLKLLSNHLVIRGMKRGQNSVVFQMLSMKMYVLESVRADSVSRSLHRVTLRSLSIVFAIRPSLISGLSFDLQPWFDCPNDFNLEIFKSSRFAYALVVVVIVADFVYDLHLELRGRTCYVLSITYLIGTHYLIR